MKKGMVYDGTVERVDFPNKGKVLIEEDGKIYEVMVKNTIAGQKIRFGIKKIKNGHVEGRLLEILESSVLETEPKRCPVFGECGGCAYLTVPYEKQLEFQKAQIKRLLAPVCPNFDTIFEGMIGSPQVFCYRNKMEYSFGDSYKGGPLALGLHKRGSIYDIVDASQCCLVHKDYGEILSCVLSHFTRLHVPYYNKSHQGILRHLLVRRAVYTGELLVSLITSSQYRSPQQFSGKDAVNCDSQEILCDRDVDCCNAQRTFDSENGNGNINGNDCNSEGLSDDRDVVCLHLQELVNTLKVLPLEGKIAGILHIVNDSKADAVKCDEMHILYGNDYFYDEILGLRFRISPFSFFQTNTKGAEVLYSKVREYIGSAKNKVVFDLYTGTGTIAQLMAPVAKKVIGVEIVQEAVDAARFNARENGLLNCNFIAGDVLKVLDEIEERPDLIILDPPRDGVHPKALKRICSYQTENIIYISCKPTSLARDLALIQGYGYTVTRMVCIGQFPNTVHVETVALLTRKAQ